MAKENKMKKQKLMAKKQQPENSKINKKKQLKKKKKETPTPTPTPPQTAYDSDSDSLPDSDSESDVETEEIRELLEPYTKDQLIDLVVDAAATNAALLARIRAAADGDVTHRKIFVFGLGWDATRETLASAFEPYGEIEECNVITDRNTGKAKGYGFVLFKTRQGASKALKQPKKKIGSRMTSCQLASAGPAAAGAPAKAQDAVGRKIYVTNVPADVDGEKLRLFFSKFGEIEAGPLGFDNNTGKSRGFALFLYKTLEGARKALQEPYKIFDGNQLHCQKAADGKNKGGAASVVTAVQPVPNLAAMAAAQNLALFGQNPNLNPNLSMMYGGLMANPNAGFLTANPMLAAAAGGFGPVGQVSGAGGGSLAMGLGGYGAAGPQGQSNFGGNSSLLGSYGTSAPMPLGMQYAYPSSQIGQSSSAKTPGAGGSFSGYPS